MTIFTYIVLNYPHSTWLIDKIIEIYFNLLFRLLQFWADIGSLYTDLVTTHPSSILRFIELENVKCVYCVSAHKIVSKCINISVFWVMA